MPERLRGGSPLFALVLEDLGIPVWLVESLNLHGNLPLDLLFGNILTALVLGLLVAGVYMLTKRQSLAEMLTLATTLVLLTVLVAMSTMVIGENTARAFGLVGALSIVRFRTVVDDTRDTAFVIFAVVVGMAVGGKYTEVALVGLPVLAGATLLSGLAGMGGQVAADCTLNIRLALGRDPALVFRDVFAKHLGAARLSGTATARGGSSLDLTYHVRLRKGVSAVAFINALNQVEGLQSIELRQL